MYKQVFDYNGIPYLVKTDSEGNLSKLDLKRQNLFQYTTIMPPSNLYPPRKFDGTQWHGATANDSKEETIKKPEPIELITAQLQMQIAKGNVQQRETQKELAKAILEISKIKGSGE